MTLFGPAGEILSGAPAELRTCRGCGCDDLHACPGGCGWALMDVDQATGICSRCAIDAGWDVRWLTCAGFESEEAA